MKTSLALGLALLGLAVTVFADNSLVDLRVSPEQDRILKSDGAEVIFDINVCGHNSVSERHSPINLALVIDHSGSMQGAKMEKARQAACIAIDQLQPGDFFSLVQFDYKVDVLVPAQPVEDKDQLKEIADGIRARGSTALYAGVEEGARQLCKYFDAKNVNRVILVSDGIANVGPSSPEQLADMAREIRSHGASVTTVGLGEDYNEDVMASIAEASGANYYYVKDAEKLPEVFDKELGEVKNVVAQDLTITIETADGVEPVEIIGMPDVHFDGNKATVHLGSFYASQQRDLLVRCRIKSPQGDSANLGRVHIVYNAPGSGKSCEAGAAADVRFTAQQADADRSVNAKVATEVALEKNTVAREEALKLQDKGAYGQAANVLRAQAAADALDAPNYRSAKLASEAKDLDALSEQMKQGQPMGNLQRKAFQYENYNQAEQKDQQ
jgi:Ca-activated chloride channel family protein